MNKRVPGVEESALFLLKSMYNIYIIHNFLYMYIILIKITNLFIDQSNSQFFGFITMHGKLSSNEADSKRLFFKLYLAIIPSHEENLNIFS